jgi:hypothetical protein
MADFVNYKTNPYNPVKNARYKSAAGTNATGVRSAPVNLIAVILQNNSASMRYLKLHNSASPVAGSTTVQVSFNVPAGQTWTHNFDAGINFTTALGFTITGGAADTDTTAVAVDDVHVTFVYAD